MKNPEIFWDRISKNYDNSSKKGSGKLSRPLLATKPYLNANDTLLDYGCATGKNAIELSEYVNNVHGIDISSKMIEIAQKKVKDKNIKNVIFTKSDIFDQQFELNSFDVIISFNVLHLLDNLESVIRRISNLLKPGGLIISNTPCLSEYKILMSAIIYIGSKLNLMPEVNMLRGNELGELFTKINYKVIENRKIDPSSSNYFIVGKKN